MRWFSPASPRAHRRQRLPRSAQLLFVYLCCSAILAMALPGCVTTKPWEREFLATPEMAPDPDPEEAALQEHYLGTREGAVGGFGGGGGGCGCN